MTTEKVSFQTIEYMHRLIAELDEANTQLRLEAASIAADERAKIVAWLRERGNWHYATDDGLSGFDRIAQANYESANAIEAGEHLA